VGIRHSDNVAPSIRKMLTIISPQSGCRSVGIVRSRTQAMEFSLVSDEEDISFAFTKYYTISVRNIRRPGSLYHKI
jgi:hypothetical protein